MAVTQPKYIAVAGISWRDGSTEKRAEPGQEVPGSVVKRSPWLLEQGLVKEAEREAQADG